MMQHYSTMLASDFKMGVGFDGVNFICTEGEVTLGPACW